MAKLSNQKAAIPPKTIYLQAEAFYDAARLLYDQVRQAAEVYSTPGDVTFMSTARVSRQGPMSVCEALGLELYLKCLKAIEIGVAPHGHSVKALFGALSITHQAAIKKHYADEIKAQPEAVANINRHFKNYDLSIDAALEASDNLFVSMRYIYETGVKEGQVFILCGPLLLAAPDDSPI